MSSLKNLEKRKWFSNFVLITFLFLVGATALLSNAFKTPVKSHNEFIEQSLVFNNKELDNITNLSLKNKSGDFTFSRSETHENAQWHMSAPRDISANSVFIEKLFSSLKTIKTKKLLADDQANRSNFSLDKPTAILTLADEEGKSIILSVGIMNTIDNSTYMKISGRTGIFHVEAPSISLENTTINDLIESNVFEMNFSTLLSFKIFKKNSSTPEFAVIKKDGTWKTLDEVPVDTKKFEEMVDDFAAVKSSFVLDQLTDQQKKQTQSLISPPLYTVKIEREAKDSLTYLVSDTTKSISEVPMNDEAHFIIIENHAPVVYVLKKDFLNLFLNISETKNEAQKSMDKKN